MEVQAKLHQYLTKFELLLSGSKYPVNLVLSSTKIEGVVLQPFPLSEPFKTGIP